MGEQDAVKLLALAPETGEVQQGVAPDELRAYVVRDAIGVVVETIAAVLDNGKILCSGLDIRRAASPAGAQVGNVVMVNLITLRLVVAGGVALVVVVDQYALAVLVDQHDGPAAGSHRHDIAVHLDVLRCGDLDLGPPEPE